MQKIVPLISTVPLPSSTQFEHTLRMLSHELRNPLNAIYGMSQILKKTEHENEQIQKSIDLIYESARDVLPLLDYISNYLLADSAIERKAEKTFDLCHMLEHLVEKYYVDAKQRHNRLFFMYAREDVSRVIGYPEELELVLSFVLGNAIRFTEQGVIFITVDMKKMSDTESYLFKIRIKDSGRGIDPAFLLNIFDLFSINSVSLGGNPGLKLSISRQILSAMGGEISIQSKVNLGTEVIIDIPLTLESDKKIPVKTLWDSYCDHMRILIVENDDRIGEILKHYLSAKETHLVAPTNAASALKSGLMQKKPYHMVVIDHQLLIDHLDTLVDLLGSFPKHFFPFFVVLSDKTESKELALLASEAGISIIEEPVLPSKLTKKIALDWSHYKNRHAKSGINQSFSMSPHILLIEDNQSNILVEKMMLESLGCRVDVALNGDEALEHVRNHNNYYHLIFLDIGLPGKQGYEIAPLLRELAVNGSTLPIIAMTAYVSDSDKAKCYRSGIIDIIAKPATIEKLEITIKQHITAI